MPWSSEFSAMLDAPTVPGLRYVLRSLPASMVAGTAHLQVPWIVASAAMASLPLDGVIAPGGTVGGSECRPPDWSAAIGSMSVPIADPSARLLASLRRGQWVELLAGAPSWGIERYQRIALGVVANLTGYGTRVIVEVRDVLSGLGSRPTTTADEYAVFGGAGVNALGTSTTLTSDFTTIDGTMLVASTANISIPNDGTNLLHGAVLVTPTTGDPFFVRVYNSTLSAIQFDVNPTSTHGTTRVDAITGDTVVECALVLGHPAEIVAKLLLSTGTALLNGPYDVLPRLWAYGLHRSLVDADDIARTVAGTQPSAGADDWEMLSEQAQTDGAALVSDMLSRGGYFLALRQGDITVRYAPSLDTATILRVLTDADIIEVETWEAWDGDYDVQYGTVVIETNGTNYSTTGVVSTSPAEANIAYNVEDFVFTNTSPIGVELRTRLKRWATQIPEKLVVRLRGYGWGAYAPGDVLGLTTRTVLRRGGAAFFRTPAMVCSVAPSWMGEPTTTMVLRCIPPEGV